MKGMERNKQTFWYAVPTGEKQPILDAAGHMTGEYENAYSERIEFRGNISPGTGQTEATPFGSDVTFDRVIVLEGEIPPIDEFCKIWYENEQYIVKKVARSLNGVSIAIRKVDVRA